MFHNESDIAVTEAQYATACKLAPKLTLVPMTNSPWTNKPVAVDLITATLKRRAVLRRQATIAARKAA